MKFTFEMYEFGDRGRIFLGYKSVQAADATEAHELAQTGLADNVQLCPIYMPVN